MDGESVGISKLVSLQSVIDHRGNLVVGEVGKTIPFTPQRFFTIANVPEGEPRGIHAHIKCHQFLVCLAGSVKAMVDNGVRREVVLLDSPSIGLHMPPLTWGAQYDYSEDAVLLVLASEGYDPDDYIHSYSDFMKIIESGNCD